MPPERELALELGVSRADDPPGVRRARAPRPRRARRRPRHVRRGAARRAGPLLAGERLQRADGARGPGARPRSRRPRAGALRADGDRHRAAPAAGDPVARIQLLRSGGGLPLTVSTPGSRTCSSGLCELDLTGSIYALMTSERYGRRPVRAIERLEPVAARSVDAAALGVRARSPLMLVERVAYHDEDSVPSSTRRTATGVTARGSSWESPPVDDLERVLALLGELGPPAGEPVVLSGGITNRNVKIRLGEGTYVLRLCGRDTEVLSIDRPTEVQATRQAHAAGVAARSCAGSAAVLPGHALRPGHAGHRRGAARAARSSRSPGRCARYAGPPQTRSRPSRSPRSTRRRRALRRAARRGPRARARAERAHRRRALGRPGHEAGPCPQRPAGEPRTSSTTARPCGSSTGSTRA